MGRIKELREKIAKGIATDVEKAELKELEAEATEVVEVEEETQEEETTEDAIEEAAEKIASKATEKVAPIMSKMDEVLAAIKKNGEAPQVSVTKESKFIVDKKYGRKSVEEAEKMMFKVPGREGRKHQEISLKSMHVIEALLQSDVQKLQPLLEGTAARGGYIVPEDWSNFIVEDIRDLSVMRKLATAINVTTDTFHLPNVASRPKAAFRSEGAVKNTSTVDFGETVLTPYSIAAIVPLSNELVADSMVNIVDLVTRYIAQGISEREEKAFWIGNGSGQPTGIDNYTFVTLDPGAGATDVQRADAIRRSIFKVPQGYRANAAYVCNSLTLERLFTLKDSNNNYLLQRLPDSPELRLNGRPVYEQNDLAAGKMFVGDFSYYYIADREGISVAISTEATVGGQSAFERNLTMVRVEKRVDAELTLTAPIVELNNLGNI